MLFDFRFQFLNGLYESACTEGDLDGDKYLVLWDEDVLSRMQKSRTRTPRVMKALSCGQITSNTSREKKNKHSTADGSPTWLSEAQQSILDLTRLQHSAALTGKLYGLCTRTADESKEGFFSRDARAFARAYKDSLDMMKHCRPISLPHHLHQKVPVNIRGLLRNSGSTTCTVTKEDTSCAADATYTTNTIKEQTSSAADATSTNDDDEEEEMMI